MDPRGCLPTARTLLLTAVALLAFAANSLLCRLALWQDAIDAVSFSSVRLLSGAAMLALIVRLRAAAAVPRSSPDRMSAAMLYLYVVCFSYAYLSLAAGTGALILFGAVQLTMGVAGWRGGERFGPLSSAGYLLAAGGVVALMLPGVAAPPPLGALSMTAAGAAWGIYSLRGRGAADPLAVTAANFVAALPMALATSALAAIVADPPRAGLTGMLLAVTSGAVTSGIGYVIWYAALRGLTALRAASVQLAVPALAALGGVLWLDEVLTFRLAGVAVAILGGVALVLAGRAARARAPD
jgi:drug/metabolite transporter (DMT)-like permease